MQAIRAPGMRMEHFLIQQAYSERTRNNRRKLILWRLGIILGSAIRCMACCQGEVTTQEHAAKCAMLKIMIS